MRKEIVELREVISKLVPMLVGRKIKVTQEGSKAYVVTDVVTRKPKRVNIPMVPDNAEPDFIAAVQGFIDHEVAHCLFTDWDELLRVVGDPNSSDYNEKLASLANIVEDTMIERRIVEVFPGARWNLERLHSHFIVKIAKPALASVKGDPVKEFERLIVPMTRALAGHVAFEEFMDREGYWQHPVVDAVMRALGPENVARFKKIKSTAEAIELARELEKILFPPQQQQQQQGGAGGQQQQQQGKSQDKPDKKAGAGNGTGERDHSESEGDEDGEGSDAQSGQSGSKGKKGGGKKAKADDKDNADAENEAGDGSGDSDESGEQDQEGASGKDGEGEDGSDAGDDEADGQNDGKAGGQNDGNESENAQDAGDGSDDDAEDEDGQGDGSGEEEGEEDEDDGARGKAKNEVVNDGGQADPGELIDNSEGSGGGGVGNVAVKKTVFDFADVDLKDADLSRQIAIRLSEQAKKQLENSDYNVFSRDYDRIETLQVPNTMNPRWITQIEEQCLQMVGKMQKDIERMMAAMSRTVRVPGLRSGRLHAPSLHRLRVNDDRVFSRKHEHKSKETAVTLLIDNSGSMQGKKIELAMTAGYALASTLERVGMASEVIGFTTGCGDRNYYALRSAVQEDGGFYHRFMPIVMPIYKEFDERINSVVKARIAYMAYAQLGMVANIDGESLEYAAIRLMKRREPRKVILVLSDGAPSGAQNAGAHLKKVAADLNKMGIDCVAIGIQDDSVRHFYDRYVVLKDARELPGLVMNELRSILQR